jgi:hypothetical protein
MALQTDCDGGGDQTPLMICTSMKNPIKKTRKKKKLWKAVKGEAEAPFGLPLPC